MPLIEPRPFREWWVGWAVVGPGAFVLLVGIALPRSKDTGRMVIVGFALVFFGSFLRTFGSSDNSNKSG